jgi:hypothetical protein
MAKIFLAIWYGVKVMGATYVIWSSLGKLIQGDGWIQWVILVNGVSGVVAALYLLVELLNK